MNTITGLLLVIAIVVLPVLVSLVFEALRKQPEIPASLYWSDDIPIQYTKVDGIKIRYVKTGHGPNLLLLHTLRTQLDIFEKVIPELSRNFTVYAPDYPGHGFSDIPDTDYTPDFFVTFVERFLEIMNLEKVTLAGISIGGSIPLLIAAKKNTRIKNIISINPYDYGNGRGVERGNFIARLIFTLARIPVLGETVMRFRNSIIEGKIMQGGVSNPGSLTKDFLQQVWASGTRKGHYRGFINLIRNSDKWEKARSRYTGINIPVLLVYGDKDWSRENERERNIKDIPAARVEFVENGGHFLSLDQPDVFIQLIRKFVNV